MRLLQSVFAIVILLAASTVARADGITFIVSTVATGSIGGENFTNSRVTLTSYLSAANLTNAISEGEYFGLGDFEFANIDGLSTTIGIAGIGTFNQAANYFVSEGQSYGLTIGDADDALNLSTGLGPDNLMSSSGPLYGDGAIIAGCDPSFGPPCPSFFATSGGDVLINSYDFSQGFGEIIVDSSVPEPSTLMLLTTGTLAAAGFIRRRIISVPSA